MKRNIYVDDLDGCRLSCPILFMSFPLGVGAEHSLRPKNTVIIWFESCLKINGNVGWRLAF